jgi:hypothetical protein
VRILRTASILAGVLLFGILVGPIAFAGWAAARTSNDGDERLSAAYHLLEAFDERYSRGTRLASVDLGRVARDCGYDEEQLLGPFPLQKSQGWTPHIGYFDLMMWLRDGFRQEVERRRAKHLSDHLNGSEIVFFDRCIRHTALAAWCGNNVGETLKAGDLSSQSSLPSSGPRPDESRRTRTICAYLDGVAARTSHRLALG